MIRRNSSAKSERRWARVTWPSRKETLVTTGLVFAMVTIAALFFFFVDQIISLGVRALFGVGG